MRRWSMVILAAVFAAGCSSTREAGLTRRISSETWGKTPAGEPVELYTLTNAAGAEARITNYGGRIVSLKMPDRAGKLADVVLGFDTAEPYVSLQPPPPYFGALIGRYGNRIAKGKFTLEGVAYSLVQNRDGNHLHGGTRGFDKVLWKGKEGAGQSLELTYISKDGEESYPGTLAASVVYTLTDKNELRLDYSATTDKGTIVNLTNHSFFNLAGDGEGDILGNMVTINADKFTPVDKAAIPTGELRSVEGTAFDFRTPHAIGERIEAGDEQLKVGAGGYDHNYVLNGAGGGMGLAAKVADPKSGRVMEVLTTEPGLQFYTGNVLNGSVRGKGGKAYPRRSGLCLETQHFPDSPNHANFPSTVLKPGARYQTTTIFRFSAM